MKLRAGIVFELLGSGVPASSLVNAPARVPDWDAEYEPERTIASLESAFTLLGCQPVRLGSPHDLLQMAGNPGGLKDRVDLALSIGEGFGSRNREAWAPVIFEMQHIPYLGSDPLTLSLSLDKSWTKLMAASAGVPTGPHRVVSSVSEINNYPLPAPFPFFVKPRYEGTAKGIGPFSRVENMEELHAAVDRINSFYDQPALVEPFYSGAEYTVTIVGNERTGGLRALPVLQRAIEVTTGIGLHAIERHDPADFGRSGWDYATPGSLSAELEEELVRLSLVVFKALDCRDFARMDFRLDDGGKPFFLEVNTLPTFDPEGSFGIIAELSGISPEELLAGIFYDALLRLGFSADDLTEPESRKES